MSNKDTILLSESEVDGEFLDVSLKKSIQDIQAGLNNTEACLMRIIENDVIEPKSYLATYEVEIELLNLVKELISLTKEFKPSAKVLKIAREEIKQELEHHNRLGQN